MSKKLNGYDRRGTQEAFLDLPKEDREFLRDYKHHIEANKMQIHKIILGENHPKLKEFYEWVIKSSENKKWYLKNINKIKLVPNGIEILGDIYDLKDTINPNIASRSFIDKERWERIDAETYSKENGKEIPDWWKIILFLPERTWPSFFSEVMGMSRLYLSTSSTGAVASKNTITFGSALSTSGRLRLMTVKK